MKKTFSFIAILCLAVLAYFSLFHHQEKTEKNGIFREKDSELKLLLAKQQALGKEISALEQIKDPTLSQQIDTVRKTCNENKDLLDEIYELYQANLENIDRSDKAKLKRYEQEIADVEGVINSEPYLNICFDLKQKLNIK